MGSRLDSDRQGVQITQKHANEEMDAMLLGWDIKTAVPISQVTRLARAIMNRHYTPSYPTLLASTSSCPFKRTSEEAKTQFFETLKFKQGEMAESR